MNNKRNFIRILESAEISFRLIQNPKITGALSRDISKGGLRFFVGKFIPKDSVMKIKIELKKIPYSFEVLAKVKWIKKIFGNESFEIGVEFTEIPRENLLRLEQYIENFHSEKVQDEVNALL